jgi:hypothetical protein
MAYGAEAHSHIAPPKLAPEELFGDHFLSHKQEGWRNRGKLFELIDFVGTVIYAILSE